MAIKNKKKAPKGRLNILVMRSQGDVANLAVSPVLLVFAFLFALVFVVVSVIIINRYFELFLDYRDLTAAHIETSEELNRLQSLYTYQASVADDYATLMSALNRADPQNEQAAAENGAVATEPSQTPDAETPANGQAAANEAGEQDSETEGAASPPGTETAQTESVSRPATLDEWAGLLPAITDPPEQVLDVERLQVAGGRFNFALLNDDNQSGRAAQGNLLMAFSVETPDGATTLVTFPDFDLALTAPDFSIGPGYNIRASKTVNGRISLPSGGVVTELMVVAQSRTGNVVMKKKLTPDN